MSEPYFSLREMKVTAWEGWTSWKNSTHKIRGCFQNIHQYLTAHTRSSNSKFIYVLKTQFLSPSPMTAILKTTSFIYLTTAFDDNFTSILNLLSVLISICFSGYRGLNFSLSFFFLIWSALAAKNFQKKFLLSEGQVSSYWKAQLQSKIEPHVHTLTITEKRRKS